jgi:hypothetical protein
LLADKGKAIFFALTLICITVLVALSKMSTDAAIPVITMLIGYTAGNGVNALTKRAPSPMLIPKEMALPLPETPEFP